MSEAEVANLRAKLLKAMEISSQKLVEKKRQLRQEVVVSEKGKIKSFIP